ncbi:hypothetical protein DIPPA_53711 [Diplonema papillatum]|nr:hypothetical protein DIPPA_53711 [Diplonema papillatum]
MQTTHEVLTIHPTARGPAVFTGGAPMPGEAVAKPVPDEQRLSELHRQQGEAYAELHDAQAEHQTNREEEKGIVDISVSAAQVVAAKARATAKEIQIFIDNAIKNRADTSDEEWFRHHFPDAKDDYRSEFKCSFVDGASQSVHGRLVVTEFNLHFADSAADVKHSLPFHQVANVRLEGLSPGVLHVYTVDCKLYRFTSFKRTPYHDTFDETAEAEALTWIDHCWRKASDVPNPTATYYSGATGDSRG